MQAVGRQPDKNIAFFDAGAVNDGVALNYADDGPDEVEVAFGVGAGHVGGLASEEGAAGVAAGLGGAADERDLGVVVQSTVVDIVEEEERLAAPRNDAV